ncbi:MAG TPA: hypothetical protein ENK89_01365 [Desulfobulbaceae bacterium]|nr:hypothetical protein [Desulfobulbaceae bacterium]HHD63714.1 hypothetical protein [Desulfobulbaceae bacterium]
MGGTVNNSLKNVICVILLMSILFMAFAFVGYAAEEKSRSEMHIHPGMECHICGMYIDHYRKTAFRLVFKDGKEFYYCGCSCALRDINEYGGLSAVREGYATGWIHQKPVDFREATYVIGSNLIPDMIPNIIAFQAETDAEFFVAKHGGRVESLEHLLALISPVGMTIPFRIPPAATPPKGIFATAVGYKEMRKDDLMAGTDDISYDRAFESRSMRPDKVTAKSTFFKMVYGLTDNMTLAAVIPHVHKKLTVRKKKGGTSSRSNSGQGDVSMSLRWRLYHDVYFDKHFGLYFGASIPTGDYDKSLPTALQLGKGSAAMTGGLLWSQHIGEFWFHSSLLGTHNFENDDDFQYGDTVKAGLALHYTPNPDNIIGVELDGSVAGHSRSMERDVHDSGGIGAYVSLVTQNRIVDFLGGSLSLRGMFGIPLYENVNGIQLGEAYHWMVATIWKRRF